jgi:c-di-GMP-binding flagellar brake protein YcgR
MELEKYLLPSHSVEITVTIRDENNRINNLILRSIIEKGLVDNVFRIIAPIYHGKVYNFHVDEVISVSFSVSDSTNKDLYSVNCKIIDRQVINSLSLLTLQVISKPSKVQRRQAFRVNIYNTYPFKLRDNIYELYTKDISSTGMLALSTTHVPTGTVFEILFDANIKPKDSIDSEYSEAKVFKVRCKVIDSMPQVEIRRYLNRIQFEGLSEVESKFLIQYLYAKQTEILHLDPNASEKIIAFFEQDDAYQPDRNSKEFMRIQIIGLISLVTTFIAIVMLMFSRPKKMYVLDYFFDFYRPQFWDRDYLFGAFILASVVILINLVGIFLNVLEIKKNNNTIHWMLLITLIVCIAIVITTLRISNINGLFFW